MRYFLRLIATGAMFVAVCNVNQTCMFWEHQPKIPKKLIKYKRIKD